MLAEGAGITTADVAGASIGSFSDSGLAAEADAAGAAVLALGAWRATTGVSRVGSRDPLQEARSEMVKYPNNRPGMGRRYANTRGLSIGISVEPSLRA